MAVNSYILPRTTGGGGGGGSATLETTTSPKDFYGLSRKPGTIDDSLMVNLENVTGQRV